MRSVKENCFAMEKLNTVRRGPKKLLRPLSPKVPASGSKNAFGFNQPIVPSAVLHDLGNGGDKNW